MLNELYMTCQVVWKYLLFKQTMFCLLFFSPVHRFFAIWSLPLRVPLYL